MKIVVIDGQGGRIRKTLIETLKAAGCGRITCVGTNTAATAAMLKAGADEGATGENPVMVAARDADVIAGPMGVIAADSMLGEITPAMAAAIAQSKAQKVLIPIAMCRITIAATGGAVLSECIDEAARIIMSMGGDKK